MPKRYCFLQAWCAVRHLRGSSGSYPQPGCMRMMRGKRMGTTLGEHEFFAFMNRIYQQLTYMVLLRYCDNTPLHTCHFTGHTRVNSAAPDISVSEDWSAAPNWIVRSKQREYTDQSCQATLKLKSERRGSERASLIPWNESGENTEQRGAPSGAIRRLERQGCCVFS